MFRSVFVLLVCALATKAALTPEQRAKMPPPAQEQVDFASQIRPIIERSCVKCHGRGRNKGGFIVETRASFLKGGDTGPAVVVGHSEESLLIDLVSGLDSENFMPQKGVKLTPREVSLMRAWIDQGLKWDNAINFARKEPANLKPRRPELPKGDKNANPIDLFLTNSGKPVDDTLFLRRAYLDTIGLLPTAAEMEAFSKNPDRAQLVKGLLARNNDYAQHWMSFWNDALRNDYKGTGYMDGGRKQITSWLYSALVTNKPFNEFVRELVNPIPQTEGFVKGIVWRGVVNASQRPELQAAQNISQVFMGVNLKCASCHDSFINDWTLADAYGLASIYSDEPLELVQCDKPLGKAALVKFLYPELGDVDPKAPRKERMRRLSQIIGSANDGRLSRTIVNRLWARFFGRGLVEPVDEMENPAWNQDLLDWLAADLVAHRYDLKQTIQLMLTSRAYQLPAVAAPPDNRGEFVFRGPVVRRLTAEEFVDAFGELTGVWSGEVVPAINFALGTPASKGSWIWTEPNAARRAAAQTVYFRKTFSIPNVPTEGRVVITADNSFKIYINGKEAGSGDDFSSPKVLNIFKFLRQGANTIAVTAINAEARPGEKDVDQSSPAGLYVFASVKSKETALEIGSDDSWKFSTNQVNGWSNANFDDGQWMAAVKVGAANSSPWALGKWLGGLVANLDLLGNARAVLVNADPLTTALGRPNRDQVNTTRASVATTLQALELTNGRTLANRLKAGAEKLAEEKDPNKVASRIYLGALGRNPTPPELTTAIEVIGSPSQAEGVEDFLWAVAMLPEFQLIR
jgi:hypothetical protein